MRELTRDQQNALAVRWREGDEAAGAKLYEFHYAAIYRRAYWRVQLWGLSEELAEDAVQDIFVRIQENIHKFDPDKGDFENWLNKITTNVIMDLGKRERVWTTLRQKKER